jgi:hypothetical protein
MKHIVDPEGLRLPIKLDATSNGEFEPVPLSPANRAANRLAHDMANRNAKRLAVSRRDFLISACGAASALLAFNAALKPRSSRSSRKPESAAGASLSSTCRATSSTRPARG